ncbi:hypothetical protein ACFL1M_03955, partial [Patescibacteria group bacterium]
VQLVASEDNGDFIPGTLRIGILDENGDLVKTMQGGFAGDANLVVEWRDGEMLALLDGDVIEFDHELVVPEPTLETPPTAVPTEPAEIPPVITELNPNDAGNRYLAGVECASNEGVENFAEVEAPAANMEWLSPANLPFTILRISGNPCHVEYVQTGASETAVVYIKVDGVDEPIGINWGPSFANNAERFMPYIPFIYTDADGGAIYAEQDRAGIEGLISDQAMTFDLVVALTDPGFSFSGYEDEYEQAKIDIGGQTNWEWWKEFIDNTYPAIYADELLSSGFTSLSDVEKLQRLMQMSGGSEQYNRGLNLYRASTGDLPPLSGE